MTDSDIIDLWAERAAIKDYRRSNPHATADDVAEYVSRLEKGVAAKHVKN